MAQRKGLPKRLRYVKGPEHETAAQNARNDSGRCMHAQAIMAVYGPESRPKVDNDFIRVTDPDTGDRYIYKTPAPVQASLQAFDAGIMRGERVVVTARVVQIKRKNNHTPISVVRKWAQGVPELAASTPTTGTLADAIIAAYKAAHPGEHVHSQFKSQVKSVKPDTMPYSETSMAADEPRTGHLPGGYGVRPGDRRTFGSRRLTQALIADGWLPPVT